MNLPFPMKRPEGQRVSPVQTSKRTGTGGMPCPTTNRKVGRRCCAAGALRCRRRSSAALPIQRFAALALLLFSTTAPRLVAQPEFDIVRIREGIPLIPISLSGFSGEVRDVLKFDLEVQGFTNVAPEVAQYNITGSNNGQVEGRVTDRISKANVLAVRYTDASLRTQAHAFADDIVLKITGKPGIARTKIAFKSIRSNNSELYVADYDGANAAPVTADQAIVAAPTWVPGRRMLYYTSYKSGYPDIYSHDLGSRERKVIAQHPGLNTSPALSPDGKRIAMILSFRGSPDLYVADAATGGNLKQLTKTREDESSPCWSPDGRTICFVSSREGTPGLYLISADGGEMRRLRTAGASRPTEPEWSPNGKWIVFTSMWRNFAICLVPAEGGDVVTLADGEDPSWAPNSRTVIFTRRARGRSTLSLLDVLTKGVKDVPQNSGSSSQPSWAK